MARTFSLNAACHCGAVEQSVRPRAADGLAYDFRATEGHPKKVPLCHSNSCRHATGQLCTSYYPSQRPTLESTAAFPALKDDKVVEESHRYFCSHCGCHVFRSIPDKERAKYSEVPLELGESVRWGVATGILDNIAGKVHFSDHVFVEDTMDGGAACWLKETYRDPLYSFPQAGRDYYTGKTPSRTIPQEQEQSHPPVPGDDQLQAYCLCKSVQFHIIRPNPSQQIMSPAIPDFLPENTEDKSWWLCENGTKYLAGLCTCRSCRLTSGFEIQTWAFVPSANIFLQAPPDSKNTDEVTTLLDFENLPPGVLKSYETSPGNIRHFCNTCGATVFSYKKDKPDLVRVSVGLFNAKEGARAETWLKWWTKRIGFQELAEMDRPPTDEFEQNDIVDSFARDLAAWGGEV
jgi:hypothetical protein